MRTFHDAVVVRFTVLQDRVELQLEDVSVYEESRCFHETGKLTVDGVSFFAENDESVAAPTFAFDDGQILELTMDERHLSVLIEWMTYSPSATRVAAYDIRGTHVWWNPEGTHLESGASVKV